MKKKYAYIYSNRIAFRGIRQCYFFSQQSKNSYLLDHLMQVWRKRTRIKTVKLFDLSIFLIIAGIFFFSTPFLAIEYTNLKQALKHPSDVTILVLDDFGISKKYQNKPFPSGIGEMKNLEILEINSTAFSSFPPEIVNCEKLKTIVLKGKIDFPKEIANCPIESIEWLISKEKLEYIPEAIYLIKTLKKLILQNQNITTISNKIEKLSNLEYLDISNNSITEIPIGFSSLINLKTLNFNHNLVKELPLFLFELKNISKLSYLDNPIFAKSLIKISASDSEKFHTYCSIDGEYNTHIREIIENAPYIMRLSIHGQKNVKEFLKNAQKFQYLVYLELSGDIILTYEIENLTTLKRLRTLVYSPLNGKIPSKIAKLSQIESFYVDLGEFSSIMPRIILQMTFLKEFHFSAYNLGAIPEAISKLSLLESLSISGNFDSIPTSISKLKNLKKLSIESPLLTRIPNDILNMESLKTIIFNEKTQVLNK